MRLFRDTPAWLEPPWGTLLAAAGLVYLAAPVLRRTLRPVAVSVVKSILVASDQIRAATENYRGELAGIVSEARGERAPETDHS